MIIVAGILTLGIANILMHRTGNVDMNNLTAFQYWIKFLAVPSVAFGLLIVFLYLPSTGLTKKLYDMKKMLFLFLALATTTFLYAQIGPDYNQIKLDKPDDYRAANTFALTAANTLLSSPIDKDKIYRISCQKFLLKWMSGTPDYGFSFGNSGKILNNNPDLMTIYLASMVKFCLENKVESKDQEKIKMGSWKTLLAYCDIPGNDVNLTKKLKKLIEANKNGELEKNL